MTAIGNTRLLFDAKAKRDLNNPGYVFLAGARDCCNILERGYNG
jgi:hypothetical protein